MAKSVGTLTVTSFVTFREFPANRMMKRTLVERFWLHPTKGWRKLERTKTTVPVNGRGFYPRWGNSRSWVRA